VVQLRKIVEDARSKNAYSGGWGGGAQQQHAYYAQQQQQYQKQQQDDPETARLAEACRQCEMELEEVRCVWLLVCVWSVSVG